MEKYPSGKDNNKILGEMRKYIEVCGQTRATDNTVAYCINLMTDKMRCQLAEVLTRGPMGEEEEKEARSLLNTVLGGVNTYEVQMKACRWFAGMEEKKKSFESARMYRYQSWQLSMLMQQGPDKDGNVVVLPENVEREKSIEAEALQSLVLYTRSLSLMQEGEGHLEAERLGKEEETRRRGGVVETQPYKEFRYNTADYLSMCKKLWLEIKAGKTGNMSKMSVMKSRMCANYYLIIAMARQFDIDKKMCLREPTVQVKNIEKLNSENIRIAESGDVDRNDEGVRTMRQGAENMRLWILKQK